jgi:hypothetical protein
MKRLFYFFLIITPLFLSAGTAVTVLNIADNRPLPGARVITPQGVSVTDANGSVLLDGNAVGTLHVKAYGFRPLQGEIAAGSTRTTFYASPITVKALYLSFWGASSDARLQEILKLARKTEINAVVIDVKNEFGLTSYKTGVKEAAEIKAHRHRTIRHMRRFMKTLKDEGIYTIGRIVVFKDGLRAEHYPESAVRDVNGSQWQNREGLGWLDPFVVSNHDYNIAIAEDAARIGFDEINFDYIRFPEKSGLTFVKENNLQNRVGAISAFLERAKQRLTPYGVLISVDTFGQVSWDKGDTGIGQTMASMKEHVDYFSPMLYPSGFVRGSMGLEDPTSNVYRVVRESLRRLEVEPVRIRPWLQAFRDYAHSRTSFRARKIREQIMAAESHGSGGWLLWNPRSRYIQAGLKDGDGLGWLNFARYQDEPRTPYPN